MTRKLQECNRAIARYISLNHLRSLTGQSDPSFVQVHLCRRTCPEPAEPRKLPKVTRPFSLLLREGSGDKTTTTSASIMWPDLGKPGRLWECVSYTMRTFSTYFPLCWSLQIPPWSSVATWMEWCQFISLYSWSSNLLVTLELSPLTFR